MPRPSIESEAACACTLRLLVPIRSLSRPLTLSFACLFDGSGATVDACRKGRRGPLHDRYIPLHRRFVPPLHERYLSVT